MDSSFESSVRTANHHDCGGQADIGRRLFRKCGTSKNAGKGFFCPSCETRTSALGPTRSLRLLGTFV